MYPKAEKSNTKKEFWTSFGAYIKPIPNAEGERINWVNYKTGIKHINFRMDVDTRLCSVAVEIKSLSDAERKNIYDKFLSLKKIFAEICDNNWIWVERTYDEDGSPLSKIYCEKHQLNIMKKEDWPEIISFFKERIIKLDEFWLVGKVNFE